MRSKRDDAIRQRRRRGSLSDAPYRPRLTVGVVQVVSGFRPDQVAAMNEAADRAEMSRSAWLREVIDDVLGLDAGEKTST